VKNTELTTQLVEEYNLPATDAENIMSAFAPVATVMSEIDADMREFTYDEITLEVCADAKRLRLRYVKARTSGDDIHKAVKASVLLQSKAIDGARNIFKLHITEREDQLKQVEKHFEIKEQKRIDALQTDRIQLLFDIGGGTEVHSGLELGSMSSDVWTAFYNGKKAEANARIEAQKTAEQEAKAQADEQERIRLENVELKKQADKAEEKAEKERIKRDKELQIERDKRDKELEIEAKAKEEAEAKLQYEIDKRDKELALEAQAKRDEEDKKEALKKEQEDTEKNKLYLDFLERNGTSQQGIKTIEYELLRNGNEFILYKKIDSITIS